MRKKTLKWALISLALVLFSSLFVPWSNYVGRLIPYQEKSPTVAWKTIMHDDMEEGVSIPAHTNTIIHFPDDMPRMDRRTLFGHRGKLVRYWGYCFPTGPVSLKNKNQFPGKLFLSEKERAARKAAEIERQRRMFSPFTTLNERTLNLTGDPKSVIRHQIEYFDGGTSCYVMSEEPLPVGTDRDDDLANMYVETTYNTDPEKADTDGDGVKDGVEIFLGKTAPLHRDSDNDGIIDGVEDANQNGRIETGETNPNNRDSDNDGLCDGLCIIYNGEELRGEDKNLNGKVDEGESDPNNPDSDDDGIMDEQEYFNCILAGEEDC